MVGTIHKGWYRVIPSAYVHSQNSILVVKGSPCFHWPPLKRWPSHQPPSCLSPGLELGMVGVKGGWIAPGVRMPATHPQPGHSPSLESPQASPGTEQRNSLRFLSLGHQQCLDFHTGL